MKRMNFKRKLISYVVISSVFLSSLLLYSPADIVLSAPGDPYIVVNTPSEGSVFDVTTIEFTGIITDDSTPPDQLSLKVFQNPEDNSAPIEITNEGQQIVTFDNQNGHWTFSKEFTEGNHSLSFVVTDLEGKSAEITRNFTISNTVVEEPANDQLETTIIEPVIPEETAESIVEESGPRPYIVDIKIIPSGKTAESEFLPAEDMTQVSLDSKIMVVIREPGLLSFTQPLIVASKNGEIKSKEDLEGFIPQKNADGDYVVTFTPSVSLDPNTTYYVYVNPTISNELGNRIFPRFFKFTTTNVYHIGDLHGNYSNNTNACAYCHSSHNGETPTLAGGQFGTADNYCMVCHDGTNGSPMPDKYSTNNKHFQHPTEQIGGSQSCTSCHNPHASWTVENPARLQKNEVQVSGTSHFQALTYKKAGTTTGNVEDFTLCFSCHDGTKATNIKQYYQDEILLAESGHNITATDGSSLNGQMACADCHETHGSSNLKLLREELGNIKLADTDKFKTAGTAWDAINERQFCLKCHNNTTEVYGKTGTFTDTNPLGEPIAGHQSEDLQGCSSCHGGSAQSAIEAAHAPKKIAPIPK